MKQYKLYLFDYDYTLVNSSPAIVECFKYIFDHNNIPGFDAEEARKTIGMPLKEGISKVTGVYDDEILNLFWGDFAHRADEVMTSMSKLFPDTLAMLKRLHNRGAKIGIISTKAKLRIEDFLNKNDLNEYFDLIIGVLEVNQPKPDPEGVYIACEKFGVEKSDVLFLGDSLYDAKTAENAGVDFCGVLKGLTPREAFEVHPYVKLIKDYSELE